MLLILAFANGLKQKATRHKRLSGVILVLLSAIFFSSANIIVKKLTAVYSSYTVAFWRGWIGVAVVLLFARFDLRSFWRPKKMMLVIRGLLGTISLVLLFSAVKMTTVNNAVALFFIYPVFGALIGSWVYRDEWKKGYLIALIAALIGIWVINRPDLSNLGLGEGFAVLSGLLAGWLINIVRFLRKTESVMVIVFYFMLAIALVTPFLMPPEEILGAFRDWPPLTLVALISTAAQFLMTFGYTYCTAAEGGVISLMAVPFTLLISFIFLGEKLNIYLLAGTICILLSGYLVAIAQSAKKTPAND